MSEFKATFNVPPRFGAPLAAAPDAGVLAVLAGALVAAAAGADVGPAALGAPRPQAASKPTSETPPVA